MAAAAVAAAAAAAERQPLCRRLNTLQLHFSLNSISGGSTQVEDTHSGLKSVFFLLFKINFRKKKYYSVSPDVPC